MVDVRYAIDGRADLSKIADDVRLSLKRLIHADTLFARSGTYTPSENHVEVRAEIRGSMELVLDRIAELLKLAPNWDTYGAPPVDQRVASYVSSLVAPLLSAGVSTPSIVPTASGGIQMEWHSKGSHLEIEVDPSGEVVFYFRNDADRMQLGETISTVLDVQAIRLEALEPLLGRFLAL